MVNVLIIGCGQTGSAIAKKLLTNKKIRSLGLYSRTAESSQRVAKKLASKKVHALKNLDSISTFDFVILTLSGLSDSTREESFFKRKTTFEVRQDELKYNLGAIVGLIKDLKRAKKTSKIIVVTNPVDEITNYLRIFLKKKEVYGFGMDLDARRYTKYLGKPVECIGTHGKAIPLIGSTKKTAYDSLFKKADSELMAYIRRKGIPHEVAGTAFAEFFTNLLSSTKEVVHACAYLEKPLAGVSNISISAPFYVKNTQILGPKKLTINAIEKEKFRQSAKQLKRSVTHILKTHKKLAEYK